MFKALGSIRSDMCVCTPEPQFPLPASQQELEFPLQVLLSTVTRSTRHWGDDLDLTMQTQVLESWGAC